jgi:ribosome assembly protein RRB1
MPDSDDDEDDDDEVEDDPILTFRAIPHAGCVNRIRARPLALPLSLGPPAPPAAYHVATFSETGKVHIFDVAPQLHSLLYPAAANAPLVKVPVFTIDSHGRAEGYALDWGNPIGGSTAGRLLSGDIQGKIYLTTMTPTTFTPSPKPFLSHTDSVEDIQWSPSEPTVFASCSADKSIRVWDVRVKDRKSVIGVAGAHDSDVNVISWNNSTNYLLASGGDDGIIKVWDLRNFKGCVILFLVHGLHPLTNFIWLIQNESTGTNASGLILLAYCTYYFNRMASYRRLLFRCLRS